MTACSSFVENNTATWQTDGQTDRLDDTEYHIRPTECSILQPRYCRQVGLSSLRRQSLEQSPCTSHLSTVAHGFVEASYKTFLFQRYYPDLIIWHSELTFCDGPSSNFVIQATLNLVDNDDA